jgi:DNA-binding CsgD family transcriptional regulator
MSIQAAIDGFYAAAIFPERWPKALDALAGSLASDGASLVLTPTRPDSVAGSTSIQPLLPIHFHLDFPDPREVRVSPTLTQGFMADHAYFSTQEIDHDPYYQEFLVPSGFGWNAAAALDERLLISLKRGVRRGHYDQPDLTALDKVLPALRSASRTATMTWDSHFCGELRAFELIGRGALLLDLQSRVLNLNACVHLGDGLDISKGSLRAMHSVDRQKLTLALAQTIAAARSGVASATMCVVRRPSGSLPWVVDAIACRDAMLSLHSRASVLVLITDLERPSLKNRIRLQEIFGLTMTEAKLAEELARGHSLQEAAARLAITVGHARQRLKGIFHKTGVSRQAELVALLGRAV